LRRITINEAARLQTFPVTYIFKGRKSSVYRQIGNAVPCLLAGKVAQFIKDTLFE
jgi:DNA (cytosine-5)-methyltransferase 1